MLYTRFPGLASLFLTGCPGSGPCRLRAGSGWAHHTLSMLPWIYPCSLTFPAATAVPGPPGSSAGAHEALWFANLRECVNSISAGRVCPASGKVRSLGVGDPVHFTGCCSRLSP